MRILGAFGDLDPITRSGERRPIGHVAGTAAPPPTTIEIGGHTLQEDTGDQVAQIIVDFLPAT
jgi:haloalkane dehalogenase